MTDQDLNSDELEVAPLENVDNESMQAEEPQIDVEAQRREEAKERDFRALRQRQKELEWENKQKDELLQRLMQQQQPQAATIQVAQAAGNACINNTSSSTKNVDNNAAAAHALVYPPLPFHS